MNTRCLACIVLAGMSVGFTANGAQPPPRRLTEAGEWFDFTRNVTNALNLGMTFSRVNEILEENRPDASFWGDTFP